MNEKKEPAVATTGRSLSKRREALCAVQCIGSDDGRMLPTLISRHGSTQVQF
jgi:hypothetical protein